MKKISKLGKIVTSLLTAVMIFGLFQMSSASAASIELTQNQKEEYYKQYVEIVKKVNDEHPDLDMEITPFEKFTDWVTPEEFKKLANDRANLKVVTETSEVAKSLNSYATTSTSATISATKTKGFKSDGASFTLTVNGTFYTNYDAYFNHQIFSGIKSITSSSNPGTWTQTGYEYQSLDASTTYSIAVSGKLTSGGLTTKHRVTIEFYCEPNGKVS